MKLFSSILILLLLLLGGPGWGQCSNNGNCSGNSTLIWKFMSGVQPVTSQGTFLNDSDTNDIDGPDSFVIISAPKVYPLQYNVNTVSIVLPFTIQVYKNTFLIDLPPPLFS